jgi:hypothetical protein
MRHELPAITVLPAAFLLLGACASSSSSGPAGSGTPAQQQALARYTANAGPPIPYFTWLGQFYSWEALSKDQLVVYTTSNEAYLLKVWPPCDMRFVSLGIGLSSTAKTVYSRSDSVVVRSSGRPLSCPIDEIRKVDIQRMRAEQHQPAAPANPTAPANPVAPTNPAPANPTAPPNPTPQR